MLTVAGVEFASTTAWSRHSCPAGVLIYSYTPHGFQTLVGAPLFSVPQFVMAPGTNAILTVALSPYDGNNLTQLIKGGWFVSNYSQIERIGHFNTVSLVALTGTGVSITATKLVQESPERAVENLTIVASPSADQTSYDLGSLDCPGAVILTIGYLPYWEPFIGIVQPVTLLVSVMIAGVIATVYAFGETIAQRRRTQRTEVPPATHAGTDGVSR
jgi:hypothetical protein